MPNEASADRQPIGPELTPIRGLDEPAAIGAFVAACLNVGAYDSWTIDSIGRFFLPPIRLGQYVVFAENGSFQGFVTWAWLSDPALEWVLNRLEDPRPYEWRSGSNLLLADFVCRSGLVPSMARHLQRTVFALDSSDLLYDCGYARAIKRDPSGAVQKLSKWPGFPPRKRTPYADALTSDVS